MDSFVCGNDNKMTVFHLTYIQWCGRVCKISIFKKTILSYSDFVLHSFIISLYEENKFTNLLRICLFTILNFAFTRTRSIISISYCDGDVNLCFVQSIFPLSVSFQKKDDMKHTEAKPKQLRDPNLAIVSDSGTRFLKTLHWENAILIIFFKRAGHEHGWLVGCGLTSHSVIFQLYSDGTVVKFPNFDLLPGTHAMGS